MTFPRSPLGATDPHVEAPPKPCSKRLKSVDGKLMWCIRPDGHGGDCHGVAPAELPAAFSALDPKRRWSW